MNKTINVLILLLFSAFGYTQTESLTERNRFNFETNVGINISNLKNDSIEFDSGKKPFLGLIASYNITERLSLQSAVNYSIKGSNSISPFLKVENQYLDLIFAPQFEILENFYFQVGLCYSKLLESHKITLTPQGREMTNISNYGSELDFFSGIKFPLQENINLFINYTIPINNTYSSNLQVGISIAINNRTEKEPSYRRIRAKSSENQIINLKESALLVRLKTSENTINALRAAEKYDKAEKVQLNQKHENEKIINAFKKNYDFSEVFFFYSYNSEKVRLKQFENIFLNESLEIDSTLVFNPNRDFFIAEFGYLERDTMKYYSHSSIVPAENGGVDLIANYYTPSSDFDFYALRIMDQHFVQLNRPFPYYTRAIYKTIRKHPEQLLFITPIYLATLTWSYDHTVARMNKELERYYKKKNKNYR
jgi:hypothetical protein